MDRYKYLSTLFLMLANYISGSDNISPFTGSEAMTTTYGYVSTLIMGSVYNAVFVIIINLVLQAIISGLIIDTFGEMRAESEEIEADIKGQCFICSIDRYFCGLNVYFILLLILD